MLSKTQLTTRNSFNGSPVILLQLMLPLPGVTIVIRGGIASQVEWRTVNSERL